MVTKEIDDLGTGVTVKKSARILLGLHPQKKISNLLTNYIFLGLTFHASLEKFGRHYFFFLVGDGFDVLFI